MALREFEDDAGTRWMAWETVPPETSVGPKSGWLTFDNGTERRRLTPIHPGWADMPNDRLVLLLKVAEPAPAPHVNDIWPTARDRPEREQREE